jgi:hypothetical protein
VASWQGIGRHTPGIVRVSFIVVRPKSFLAEEIAKDPTSPIAVAHEMARKNGTTPGAFNPIFAGLALLAAFGIVLVDARGRPVLASVAYSLTIFVTVSSTLARMPAFAQSLPSVPETATGGCRDRASRRSRGRARPAGDMAGAARLRGRPRRSHTSVTGARRVAGALRGAVSYHRGDVQSAACSARNARRPARSPSAVLSR